MTAAGLGGAGAWAAHDVLTDSSVNAAPRIGATSTSARARRGNIPSILAVRGRRFDQFVPGGEERPDATLVHASGGSDMGKGRIRQRTRWYEVTAPSGAVSVRFSPSMRTA